MYVPWSVALERFYCIYMYILRENVMLEGINGMGIDKCEAKLNDTSLRGLRHAALYLCYNALFAP